MSATLATVGDRLPTGWPIQAVGVALVAGGGLVELAGLRCRRTLRSPDLAVMILMNRSIYIHGKRASVMRWYASVRGG